jgi:hypothetical protein
MNNYFIQHKISWNTDVVMYIFSLSIFHPSSFLLSLFRFLSLSLSILPFNIKFVSTHLFLNWRAPNGFTSHSLGPSCPAFLLELLERHGTRWSAGWCGQSEAPGHSRQSTVACPLAQWDVAVLCAMARVRNLLTSSALIKITSKLTKRLSR